MEFTKAIFQACKVIENNIDYGEWWKMIVKLLNIYNYLHKLLTVRWTANSCWRLATTFNGRIVCDRCRLSADSPWSLSTPLRRYRHFADATRHTWVELCRYRRVSIATQLNSTDPVEHRTAKSVEFLFMTSRPTNWVNWVTTFIDRWQLFTLWTCRQLDVGLSWVELCCVVSP